MGTGQGHGEPGFAESMNVWHRVPTRLVPTDAWSALGDLGVLGPGAIPRGGGMSFGDSAMREGGHALQTDGLAAIGPVESGEIEVGGGVPMGALATQLQGTDWDLPVHGGTRHATVGGAVAADIHGKNDVAMGSFGNHLRSLDLRLVDGSLVRCAPELHPELFAATVGGMGLTGVVERVRLALTPRSSMAVRWSARRFDGWDELAGILAEGAPWQAAWVDALHPELRGLVHQAHPDLEGEAPPPKGALTARVPKLPLVHGALIGWLNRAMLMRHKERARTVHLWDFVWSTDRFLRWHRLYGPGGCDEYQFAAPAAGFAPALEAVRHICQDAGMQPCFAMVKPLGSQPRVGMLSFPVEGHTYTANFPHRKANGALFSRLMDAVIPHGGRGYLAKDTTMTPAQFRAMYPQLERWQAVAREVDPGGILQSDQSLRLELKPW